MGSAYWTGCMALKGSQTAEARLNAAYQKLMATLKNDYESERKKLIAAQRTWIKYRQEYCEVEGEIKGGAREWQSTYTTECRADLASGRATELEKLHKSRFE